MSDLIERLRTKKFLSIRNQLALQAEAADELAALRERVAVLDAEMARFVSDFEMDFVLDGAIVDNPDPMLKTHYVLSRAILAKQEASHEG